MHYMYKNEQMNSLCGEKEKKKTQPSCGKVTWGKNHGKNYIHEILT